MNIDKNTIIEKLAKYKWLLIPVFSVMFFTLITLLIMTPGSNQTQPDEFSFTTYTPSPSTTQNNKITDDVREGNEESVEERPGRMSKEALPDGTTRYTFASSNPARPNIIISKGAEDILFQRTIMPPTIPTKISDYTQSYGAATWIFKGSVFYGAGAQTHVYPELGFGFIGNPTTGEVFEQHVFTPLKIEEYVKNYGDDIPN
jgi:hypothetical protein